MKNLLFTLILIVLLTYSCGVCKHNIPPVENNTVIHVVDSIVWHDSTIYHIVPKEIYKDYTALLDTMRLSTSYSEFAAYIDTTANLLKGFAKNTVDKIPVKTKWKERVVYKDSISYIKEPYPVEVVKEITKYPQSYWWFMGFTILVFVYFGIRIYLKLKFKL